LLKTEEAQFVEFLQWALPRLALRWPGFRKVRRQVIKRLGRRINALQLPDLDAYRRYLESHEAEWSVLDSCCRITISRFYRDRHVFDVLAQEGLPELVSGCRAQAERQLRCWSVGCGAGEEAYTLVLIWMLHAAPQAPPHSLSLIATDADVAQIARARKGCYPPSSLKELPPRWRELAFTREEERFCIKPEFRRRVQWAVQDLRKMTPAGVFELILCRNLVFTYFSMSLQRELLQRLEACLSPGGLLVIGAHETLPDGSPTWGNWRPGLPIYRKRG
jgi:chemotaxis protein methyltransferase CheR